jgi:alkylation response protein AidB-like acyl-CoA dehydrogenase
MNFDFTEHEKAVCEQVKDVFRKKGASSPAVLETADVDETRRVTLQSQRDLAEIGYLALGVEDGRHSPGLVVAQEWLAAASPSLFMSVEVTARILGRLVARYGSEAQKSALLDPIKDGRIIGAVALSEGGLSIEDRTLKTAATPENRGFSLNGVKACVVNGPVADWTAVAAGTKGGNGFFLLRSGSQGLFVGARSRTLGYEGMVAAAMSFENCPILPEQVIGPFEGCEVFRDVRKWENQVLTSASLGSIKSSYEAALQFAKHHMSGGKPIIAYQEVGFKLAEMFTLLQTAELLACRAAWMDETGDREADLLLRSAKVFCSESAEEVASKAIQVMGLFGYLKGNAAEMAYRDAKYVQVAGTSTEISRVKIGDELLGWNQI